MIDSAFFYYLMLTDPAGRNSEKPTEKRLHSFVPVAETGPVHSPPGRLHGRFSAS
jgi:hypothetical protein